VTEQLKTSPLADRRQQAFLAGQATPVILGPQAGLHHRRGAV
jgi:hypothetical protein